MSEIQRNGRPPDAVETEASEPQIVLTGLEKSFGNVRALTGLTFAVPAGPVGLLGPNGAGKTTMIKLLLGLLTPTSGSASIAGLDPRKRSERRRVREAVGYMPEGDCMLPGMSGIELVATLGRLTGLSWGDAMTRAHEVLDYVLLEEARYRPLVQYSTGMKQRLKLAQALVHDPPILLLDEPTNGLDPKGRREMLALVHDLGRNQKKNVLLCSHLLPDVEKTCDHVIVLNKGTVVEEGAVADMTRANALLLKVRVRGAAEPLRLALAAAGIAVEASTDDALLVTLGEGDDADPIFEVAARCGSVVTALDPMRSTLEEVFLRAVGAEGAAAATSPEEVPA